MEDRTPDTPQEPTPNPHAGEPVPPPQEGLRPEADPSVVRPDQDEPNGPLSGLVHAAATEIEAEVTDSDEAHAEAVRLGVEGEGVETGELIGLIAATIVSVAVIVLAIYFIFYLPVLNTTQAEAEEVPGERYVELRENRAEAFDKISQYATSPDGEGIFRMPIESAMALLVDPAPGAAADAPVTRAQFNTSWMDLHPAPAVAVVPQEGLAPADTTAEGVVGPAAVAPAETEAAADTEPEADPQE